MTRWSQDTNTEKVKLCDYFKFSCLNWELQLSNIKSVIQQKVVIFSGLSSRSRCWMLVYSQSELCEATPRHSGKWSPRVHLGIGGVWLHISPLELNFHLISLSSVWKTQHVDSGVSLSVHQAESVDRPGSPEPDQNQWVDSDLLSYSLWVNPADETVPQDILFLFLTTSSELNADEVWSPSRLSSDFTIRQISSQLLNVTSDL